MLLIITHDEGLKRNGFGLKKIWSVIKAVLSKQLRHIASSVRQVVTLRLLLSNIFIDSFFLSNDMDYGQGTSVFHSVVT